MNPSYDEYLLTTARNAHKSGALNMPLDIWLALEQTGIDPAKLWESFDAGFDPMEIDLDDDIQIIRDLEELTTLNKEILNDGEEEV